MRQPLTAAERAKRFRDKQKQTGNALLRVPLSQLESDKLKEITQFYGWPDQTLDTAETVQLMIHRFHGELEAKRNTLGNCKYCGESLPQGCAKLKAGGLFKGDSNCFHTTNRLSIAPLNLENIHECN